MAIIKRKPRNPSLRFQTFLSSDDITTTTPHKSLSIGLKNLVEEMHMGGLLFVIAVVELFVVIELLIS